MTGIEPATDGLQKRFSPIDHQQLARFPKAAHTSSTVLCSAQVQTPHVGFPGGAGDFFEEVPTVVEEFGVGGRGSGVIARGPEEDLLPDSAVLMVVFKHQLPPR